MTFEDTVGEPDEVGEMKLVKVDNPVVLFSVGIDMTNDGDEEVFIDADGNLDDIDGADVTLALALEDMTGVELLAELVGMTDAEEVPVALVFEEIVGSPEEDKPLDEVLLDKVGRPDEAEVVWDLMNEVFNEAVGSPDRAVTLGEVRGGIVPEELLIGIVDTPDGANVVENPISELFKDSVGNPDGAVDGMVVMFELECVGISEEAEEVPLRRPSASGSWVDQHSLT